MAEADVLELALGKTSKLGARAPLPKRGGDLQLRQYMREVDPGAAIDEDAHGQTPGEVRPFSHERRAGSNRR